MFGDDGGGAVALVADGDAEAFGSGKVDGIGADGAEGEEADAFELFEDVRGPLHGAVGVEDDLGAVDALEALVVVGGEVVVDRDLTIVAEAIEVG